jgi:signal peptide peptidase SppA
MSRRAYSRAAIMQRLFNAPLQVLPDTASIVLGAIGDRFDIGQLFVAAEGRTIPLGELEEKATAARLEISSRAGVDQLAPLCSADDLMRVINGTAFVEIRGELVSENGIGPSSGFTGYDGIRAQVMAADADENVKRILVDVDSPGGEVAGLYELTKMLMARRGTKPMRAVIRGVGASAAYAVACCADEITLSPLGLTGSIGTISMHADFSGQLAQEGIKVTLITAGAHKADGNPFEPLPAAVRDWIAAMVNKANDQFLAHVAAARGLSVDQVRAQEAQVYRGDEALAVNLVDKVMGWADSIEEFAGRIDGPGISGDGGEDGGAAPPAPGAQPEEEQKMENPNPAPAASSQPEFTQATQEAAVVAAVAAERARVTALAELDAESSLSEGLSAAIAGGTSAGDFATQLVKAGREQQTAALAAARGDAPQPGTLPEAKPNAGGASGKVNRGEQAVEKLRGKHRGLPAKA